MSDACTWCLAMLTDPAAALNISTAGEDAGQFQRVYDATRGDLAAKRAVMAEAFERGWTVLINGHNVRAPVTTWHGDPVCEVHLYELAERERQPRTVRMAQWRP